MTTESLFYGQFEPLDNREVTLAHLVEIGCDHPYTRSLVDDIYRLIAAGDRMAERLGDHIRMRRQEAGSDACGMCEEAIEKWAEERDQ